MLAELGPAQLSLLSVISVVGSLQMVVRRAMLWRKNDSSSKDLGAGFHGSKVFKVELTDMTAASQNYILTNKILCHRKLQIEVMYRTLIHSISNTTLTKYNESKLTIFYTSKTNSRSEPCSHFFSHSIILFNCSRDK